MCGHLELGAKSAKLLTNTVVSVHIPISRAYFPTHVSIISSPALSAYP